MTDVTVFRISDLNEKVQKQEAEVSKLEENRRQLVDKMAALTQEAETIKYGHFLFSFSVGLVKKQPPI